MAGHGDTSYLINCNCAGFAARGDQWIASKRMQAKSDYSMRACGDLAFASRLPAAAFRVPAVDRLNWAFRNRHPGHFVSRGELCKRRSRTAGARTAARPKRAERWPEQSGSG